MHEECHGKTKEVQSSEEFKREAIGLTGQSGTAISQVAQKWSGLPRSCRRRFQQRRARPRRTGLSYYVRVIGRDGITQDNLTLGFRMEF